MIKNDIYNTKTASYFFIPHGHKNGRDVFMPADKLKRENLPFPLIRLDYEGPPLEGSNRYRMHISHNGKQLAPSVGTHIKITETFEEALTEDVIEFLKISREYYNEIRGRSD
jgi:hypothetical protein